MSNTKEEHFGFLFKCLFVKDVCKQSFMCWLFYKNIVINSLNTASIRPACEVFT